MNILRQMMYVPLVLLSCSVCWGYESSDAVLASDVPLKWTLMRWESIVVVQAGERRQDSGFTVTEKKIVEVLRGRQEVLPPFGWDSSDLRTGQYYLFCYQASLSGVSAWRRFDLKKTKDEFDIIALSVEFRSSYTAAFIFYPNFPLADLRDLLESTPFDVTTYYARNWKRNSGRTP